MASIEAALHTDKSPTAVEQGTAGIKFIVSPDLSIPKSRLSTKTVEKIFTPEDWNNYIPHGFKLIGIWDKEYKKKEMVTDSKDIPHPFLRATFQAYSKHYPLKLRPDDIWLLILQGSGLHINKHSEDLRSQFVDFEGKKLLEVVRPEFVLDSLDNDWGGVTLEFLQKIGENTIGDFKEICETSFSTSTLLDQVTRSMTVMHAMQKYFSYMMRLGCGFPYILLEGTKEDWTKLKHSTARLLSKLDKFGTEWSQCLLPLLDKMTEPFDGVVDKLFWNAMFVLSPRWGPSGMHVHFVLMSGWVNIFFPYLHPKGYDHGFRNKDDSYVRNPYCIPYDEKKVLETEKMGGENRENIAPDWELFPDGRLFAPGTMVLPPKTYDIRYYSGFLGVNQDGAGVISTQVGWYVIRDLKELKS